MSTIDTSSQKSLNAILDKLGVKSAEEEKSVNNDQLGQEEFLTLMTTQLQNQDPFAPMENTDMIAQMAQFSTVTGITDMNQTLNGLAETLAEFRIATASNMLGNSVMIPGNYARPDNNGEIHGMLDLPSASGVTSLAFTDKAGAMLHPWNLALNRLVWLVFHGKIFLKTFLIAASQCASKLMSILVTAWKR